MGICPCRYGSRSTCGSTRAEQTRLHHGLTSHEARGQATKYVHHFTATIKELALAVLPQTVTATPVPGPGTLREALRPI